MACGDTRSRPDDPQCRGSPPKFCVMTPLNVKRRLIGTHVVPRNGLKVNDSGSICTTTFRRGNRACVANHWPEWPLSTQLSGSTSLCQFPLHCDMGAVYV